MDVNCGSCGFWVEMSFKVKWVGINLH
jgi:hypothetical protein